MMEEEMNKLNMKMKIKTRELNMMNTQPHNLTKDQLPLSTTISIASLTSTHHTPSSVHPHITNAVNPDSVPSTSLNIYPKNATVTADTGTIYIAQATAHCHYYDNGISKYDLFTDLARFTFEAKYVTSTSPSIIN